MSKASRDKGNRMERAIVNMLQDRGRAAERQPLSGALGGRHRSDVSVPVLGEDWLVECKSRARDFVRLYAWLEGSDALIIKSDRKPPLLVLRLDKAVDVLDVAEGVIAP